MVGTSKMHLSEVSPLVVKVAVRSKAMVLLVLNYGLFCPHCFWGSVFGPCFVILYSVLYVFLVLYYLGREEKLVALL